MTSTVTGGHVQQTGSICSLYCRKPDPSVSMRLRTVVQALSPFFHICNRQPSIDHKGLHLLNVSTYSSRRRIERHSLESEIIAVHPIVQYNVCNLFRGDPNTECLSEYTQPPCSDLAPQLPRLSNREGTVAPGAMTECGEIAISEVFPSKFTRSCENDLNRIGRPFRFKSCRLVGRTLHTTSEKGNVGGRPAISDLCRDTRQIYD